MAAPVAGLLQLKACAAPAAINGSMFPPCVPPLQPPRLTSLLCVSTHPWRGCPSQLACTAERHEGRGGSTSADCNACTSSSMART